MNTNKESISGTKIKQIGLIFIILSLIGLISYNLSTFIPSLLGAITLYIVFRKLNFYLQEQLKWKPMLAAISIILICLVTLILPVYLLIDMLVDKVGNSLVHLEIFNVFTDKIHNYIYEKTNVDILSKENIDALKNAVAKFSTSALSGTINILTLVVSMFFILYFPLEKPRLFEQIIISAAPLKRSNIDLIGKKFTKLVIANAVGIPIVAIGQGIVALVGYLILGAPSPVLLFALTIVSSMIPIVGAAIIYIPVCLYMIASGDTISGIILFVYCIGVVGMTDNILRFTLLKKLEDIHPLNTIFGIIMGLNVFGFMGLIFGPILVSMTILLIQIYRNEFGVKEENEASLVNEDGETTEIDSKLL